MSERKDKDLRNASVRGPMEFTDLIARIFKDCSLLLLIGLCLFSLMAVMGYDTKDPGWSHVAYQPVVTNWTGLIGALWADIGFSFIGLCAWGVPFMLLFPCVRLYQRKNVSVLDSLPFVMLRIVGGLVFIFSACGLLSLHLSNKALNYPFTSGGIIGQAFSDWMVSWFSLYGSSFTLFFSAAIGWTLFMELSWKELSIALGGALLLCVESVVNLFSGHESTFDKAPQNGQETPNFSSTSQYHLTEPSTASHSILANSELERPVIPTDNSERPPSVIDQSLNAEKVDSQQYSSDAISFLDDQSPVQSPADRLQSQAHSSFMAKIASKFSKKIKQPRITPIDSDLDDNLHSDNPALQSLTTATGDKEYGEREAHLEKPLPILTKVNLSVSRRTQNISTPPEKCEAQPAEPVNQASTEAGSSNHAVSVPAGSDVNLNSVDVAQNISEENQSTKRQLKIVPLSETHLSTLSEDSAFVNQQQSNKLASVLELPDVGLLDPPELQTEVGYTQQQLEDMSRLLEVKLKDFGVIIEVVEVNPGPVITRFEIQPAPGVKSSKIVNLAKDLARSLAVMSVRVVEVIPGKSVMGIEIPNISRKMVRLSEVLSADVYQSAASRLTLALGNDIAGNPVVANLAKMPHLLVAGTTGSGKSVGVNAMILSLLFKAGPEEVRLMLVDPKMLELSIYEGIPHLLTPVITDMKEAAGGLRWCVAEMERRYKLMSKMGVRNLDGFNEKVREAIQAGTPLLDPIWNPQEHGESPGTQAPRLETLPYIVVVIDEFADMMMIVGKKVEELIARIAQKARAAGIHLILATQRPSVDVITGLIKANVPTRIAFQVSSRIDSRTILDQGGSENLLGNGDMLFLPAGTSVPSRVHGAFVSDDEVHRTVEAWKKLGKPEFIDIQMSEEGHSGSTGSLFEDDEQDVLYDESVAFITSTRKVSISSVQRKFKIGYNRAARMVESMEAAGVITTAGSNGQREVIAPPPPEF